MSFIDPSPLINARTLDFLAKELERDIKFTSIFDTIFQASVAISSNLNLNPLLNKTMSLSEEIINPEVTAMILLDSKGDELYWEVSRGEKPEFFKKRSNCHLERVLLDMYCKQKSQSFLMMYKKIPGGVTCMMRDLVLVTAL